MISPFAISAVTAMSALWFTPAQPIEIPFADWTPEPSDHLIVDTSENQGYLLRVDNGFYTQFPVITGQKRVVRYLGMTYNAATPDWQWAVKSRHMKGDHITFGPTGRFFRLYKNGEQYTSYGIHEHRSEEKMFGEESRYQSMGCIIVQRAVLDVIERTWEINGERLEVVTQESVQMNAIDRESRKET